jgi:hypothetical protein
MFEDVLNQIAQEKAAQEAVTRAGIGATLGLAPPYQELAVDPAKAQEDPRGLMADLIRSQWADFQKNALPVVDSLRAMTTYDGNPGVADALKEQGMAAANTAYGNTMGKAARDTQRFGMAITPGETSTLTRAAGLNRTAATVDATNRADDFQKDLNRQIVAGAGMAGGRSY